MQGLSLALFFLPIDVEILEAKNVENADCLFRRCLWFVDRVVDFVHDQDKELAIYSLDKRVFDVQRLLLGHARDHLKI
jgi:hypothetical protein